MVGDHHPPMSGQKLELLSGGWLRFDRTLDFDPRIEDIATGLAHTCRFAGQCIRYYSVAEHSCLVALLVEQMGGGRDMFKAALLHDAAEAYLHDVSAPLKAFLRERGDISYDVLTRRVERQIAVTFDVPLLPLPAIVRDADLLAFALEAQQLLPSQGGDGYVVPPHISDLRERMGGSLSYPLGCTSAEEVREVYLTTWLEANRD